MKLNSRFQYICVEKDIKVAIFFKFKTLKSKNISKIQLWTNNREFNKAASGPLCAAQYVPTLPTISLVRNFADKDETKFEIIPITLSTSKILLI